MNLFGTNDNLCISNIDIGWCDLSKAAKARSITGDLYSNKQQILIVAFMPGALFIAMEYYMIFRYFLYPVCGSLCETFLVREIVCCQIGIQVLGVYGFVTVFEVIIR